MNMSSIGHGSFTLNIEYPSRPERVYKAWTDPEVKARWFIGPEGWELVRRQLDFSIGGIEILHGRFKESGLETLYTARYHAMTDTKRIVYVYDMHLNGEHHSTSLATVEFVARGEGTRMVYNEQIAFLDGTDAIQGTESRKHGTAVHFERSIQLVLSGPK